MTEPEPEAEAEDEGVPSQHPPREEMLALLAAHEGNIAQFALPYGKHRQQIYRWLKRLALDAEDLRKG